jgi:hypothetical protein
MSKDKTVITKEENERRCKLAMEHYEKMSLRESRLEIAYEIQGFIAMQSNNGMSIEISIELIKDLLDLVKKANDIK